MGRRKSLAFTLVELLVVIAIIGTLVGLLLPAIQRARESSRRSTCLSNIRQLAMAATQFDGRMRKYPPLFGELPVQKRRSAASERWTTWAVLLLPDVEQAQLYDAYARGDAKPPEVYIETYMCPSNSTAERSGNAMSYAANAGMSASVTEQKPANGAFLNRIYESKAAVVDGHWKDGRDKTLAFSERNDALGYDVMGWNGMNANPNNPEEDHIDRGVVDEAHEDRVWGPAFVWHYDEPSKCAYINGPICGCTPFDEPPCVPLPAGRYVSSTCTFICNVDRRAPNAKPSSEHGGGVNVAYASGRAGFLREDIDYRIYRALMTLNQAQSDVPPEERTFIVDEAELQ